MTFSRKLEITIMAFVLMLTVLLARLFVLIDRVEPEMIATVAHARAAAFEVRLAAVEQRQFLREQSSYLALYARQSDDLARIVDNVYGSTKKINNETIPQATKAIRSLDTILTHISERTLPQTDRTVKNLGDFVATLTPAAQTALERLAALLDSGRLSSDELRAIIERVRDSSILDSMASAVANTDEATKAVKVIAQEFAARAPQLAAGVADTSTNVAGITSEVWTYGRRVNQPLTTKQKIVGFFFESFIKSAPVLLRR